MEKLNLFGINTIDAEQQKMIARRTLDNLLTSYADEADIFTEIIQNAMDSLLQAEKQGLYGDDSSPEITIILGRRQNGHHYLHIGDNGLGMSKEVASNLTVPGYSFKKSRGTTIGYKGVGASYFFAASQCVALKTIDVDGNITKYTVRGSYDWIKNDGEPDPRIDDSYDVPKFVEDNSVKDRGTGVYFQFHQGIRPNSLNNIVKVSDGSQIEIKNWMSYLATKTAIGVVDSSGPLGIKIKIMLDLGPEQYSQLWEVDSYNVEEKKIGYPFPQRVFKVGADKQEIDKLKPAQQPTHNRRHQAIYYRWDAEEIIQETSTLDSQEIEALRNNLQWVEGYFCHSTSIFDEIHDRMGGRSRLIRHGIRLACDGTPQGRMLDISLTSSQGLDRQTHIVMNFKGLELDTGRKISSNELVATGINKLGQRVVSVLKEYRWAMKKSARPDVQSDLDSWRSAIEQRSQESVVKQLYLLRELEQVFEVDPDSESEVIALFVSMVTHGMIKGYKINAISGYNRYDSLTMVDVDTDAVKNTNDVLSIRNNEDELKTKLMVLEFKYGFESLLGDFDEKKKNPAEIDVLVCWTIPSILIHRGTLQPTYGDWRDYRQIYAGTHIWRDENETTEIFIVALRNVVAELLADTEVLQEEPGLGVAMLKRMVERDHHESI